MFTMIPFIVILCIFHGAQAVLHFSQLPSFYLTGVAPTTLRQALANLITTDHNSEDRVPERYVVNSFGYGGPNGLRPMSYEETAAVRLYTGASPLHRLVNSALRSLDETALTRWAPYLRLLHTAVEKLPEESRPSCRGMEGLFYIRHTPGQTVSLPSMSFSNRSSICRIYAGLDRGDRPPLGQVRNCTLLLITPISGRFIKWYSTIPDDDEVMLLPGTFATIKSIAAETGDTCRLVELQEVERNKVQSNTPGVNLGNQMNALQIQQHDNFIREYFSPSVSVRVYNSPPTDITIAGGYGTASPWPYITNIRNYHARLSSELRVNKTVTRINDYSIRGLTLLEIDRMIGDAKRNQPYIDYYVAARLPYP